MSKSLRETIEAQQPARDAVSAAIAAAAPMRHSALIKARIHRDILSQVDLHTMETMPQDRLRAEVKALAEKLLDQGSEPVNDAERRQIVEAIQNEMLGLGPIEPLLADPTISDSLVNGPGTV